MVSAAANEPPQVRGRLMLWTTADRCFLLALLIAAIVTAPKAVG